MPFGNELQLSKRIRLAASRLSGKKEIEREVQRECFVSTPRLLADLVSLESFDFEGGAMKESEKDVNMKTEVTQPGSWKFPK